MPIQQRIAEIAVAAAVPAAFAWPRPGLFDTWLRTVTCRQPNPPARKMRGKHGVGSDYEAFIKRLDALLYEGDPRPRVLRT
jgi:hypothetical protein